MPTELSKDGLRKRHFGYAYGANSLIFLAGCLVYAKFEHRIPRKLAMALGFLLSGICFLFIGPSGMFDISTSLYSKLAFFFVLGFTQTVFFIPIIPELIESLIVNHNIVEGKDPYIDLRLND